MNWRVLSVAVVALFAVSEAHAGYYYNSLVGSPGTPNNGFPADGPNDGGAAMAQSFYAPGATTGGSYLTMSLLQTGDSNRLGVGSLMVYLVPDVGGGSPGVASTPQFSAGGFTNAQLIGTVLASSLTNSPSTVSFNIDRSVFAAVSPFTSNDEYWIGVLPSSSDPQVANGAWVYNDGSVQGTGYAGQFSWVYVGGTGFAVSNLPLNAGGGPYEMSLTVPEPMSLAIVGVGLAGLGVVRRRNAAKAKAS